MRGVRVAEGKFFPPQGGWGAVTYNAVLDVVVRKRKADAAADGAARKAGRVEEGARPVYGEEKGEIIVLGLAYGTDTKQFRAFFEQFGKVAVAEVKVRRITDAGPRCCLALGPARCSCPP